MAPEHDDWADSEVAGHRRTFGRAWLYAASVAFAYFAATVATLHLYLVQKGGGVLFFPSSAILFVALIRTHRANWRKVVGLAMIADVAASIVMTNSPLYYVAAVCLTNMIEGLFVAIMWQRCPGVKTWFLSWRCVASFAVSSALAAMIACVIVVTPSVFGGQPLGGLALLWLRTATVDALGLIMIGSLLLCWTEPRLRGDLSAAKVVEILVGTGIVGLASHFAFTSSLALLFVIFPLLALLTVRTGLPGATVGAAALTTIAAWHTNNGAGAIATLPGFAAGSPILVLQLYFLMAVLSTSPIAVTLLMREMMAARLGREHEISRAALDNMAEGLCMFDAEQRLITCNPQYAELYDLPEELLRPGTPLIAIVRHQIAMGIAEDLPDTYLQEGASGSDSLARHSEIELADGRIIDIHRRPTETGGWVATYEDVTESRRAAHQIAYLANHDPLTGLPNRACFHDRLQTSIANAERGEGFALHCLDLDRFKTVNDTMGHAAGDELLRQVADRLQELAREGDMIARLGGDEFAIIQYPVAKPEDVSAMAARIVDSLGQPYHIDDGNLVTGTSVGIALAPWDTTDMSDLLQKGDLALYRAKADGRGAYRFFEPGMDSILRKRRLLEVELRSALGNGEFELHYQPILNMDSNAVTTFEALLRWEHPIRGTINPSEFIPVAEDSGLIIPIGEWVIRQACREAANWPDHVKVAVNVSALQFKDRKLVSTITSALAATGLSANRLEIEITEALLIHDPEAVLQTLNQLHALGISISMDDFGTGYSSLNYLRDFPFNKIKIDQSFVKDIAKADCLAIVHATVELSSRLGITTIAEGVETAEQLAILKAEGCGNIQGYFIGKPLPGRQVMRTLKHFGGRHGEVRKSA